MGMIVPSLSADTPDIDPDPSSNHHAVGVIHLPRCPADPCTIGTIGTSLARGGARARSRRQLRPPPLPGPAKP